MEIEFRDESLRRLFEDAGYDGGYARPLVRAFRKRVPSIRAAADERDLRLAKGNHFEKLTGRSGEHSVRANRCGDF
jgi:plasmid maintenance system killer protein